VQTQLRYMEGGPDPAYTAITFPAVKLVPKLNCLVTEAHVCEQLAQGCYLATCAPCMISCSKLLQCTRRVSNQQHRSHQSDALLLHYKATRISEKKQSKLFSHKFVKCLLNLIIFGTKMAKTMKSCKVHSFFTSSNLCQHTTM